MIEMQPCVYLLAIKQSGTLYPGVTSGLKNRVGNISQNPNLALPSVMPSTK